MIFFIPHESHIIKFPRKAKRKTYQTRVKIRLITIRSNVTSMGNVN